MKSLLSASPHFDSTLQVAARFGIWDLVVFAGRFGVWGLEFRVQVLGFSVVCGALPGVGGWGFLFCFTLAGSTC